MTGPGDLYHYEATILRVIDGDTFAVSVDLGCRVHWHGSLRCAGYNAPEVRGDTKAAGLAATAYVEQLCPVGTGVFLDSLAFEPGDETDHFRPDARCGHAPRRHRPVRRDDRRRSRRRGPGLTMRRLLWAPSAAFLATALGWALTDRLVPRLRRTR